VPTATELLKTPEADWPPGWRRLPGSRPYSDDARRMADTMNLHAVAGSRGWAVFALADGRSPGNTAYDDISDAHRAMKWDRDRYLYLQIPAGGVNDPAEMQGCLDYARVLSQMGYRLPDPRDFHAPDRGFPVHQPPGMRVDWARQIRELTRKANL
jgi:hypothetical protein